MKPVLIALMGLGSGTVAAGGCGMPKATDGVVGTPRATTTEEDAVGTSAAVDEQPATTQPPPSSTAVPAPPPPAPAASARGLRMVRIPGGTFMMGSNRGDDDEKPVHWVQVSTFEMDVTEVTVEQYRDCMKAGKCDTPKTGRSYNWGENGRAKHPINGVGWQDANNYCRWAGKRLPTEEEWEYAARSGGRDQKYPWGNVEATCDYAIIPISGCDEFRTWPVCSKPRGNTAQGLCDMAGNVWEWTSTRYCRSYSPSAECSESRVFRGGSWGDDPPVSVRAAQRNGAPPTWRADSTMEVYRADNLGFRCVR